MASLSGRTSEVILPAGDAGRTSGAQPADEGRARLRRLMHTSVLGLVLKAVGILLAWASQLVLARLLGVEAFGIYVTVIAWVTVLALAGGFGMPIAAIRFLATYAERQDWAQYRGFLHAAWQIGLASSLAVGVLVLAGFATIPALQPLLAPMAVAAPLVLLLCLSGIAYSTLLAAQMPLRADALTNVIRPVVVTALVGASWLLGLVAAQDPAGSATVALELTVLAGVLVLLLQGVGLWPVVAPRWSGARRSTDRRDWVTAAAAAMVTVGAMALIERLDTILLSAMVSPAVAGPYSVVARLALLVSVALNPVAALVGPMGAQLLARNDRAGLQRVLGQSALLCTAIGLLLSIAIVIGGPLLLGLFGPDYQLGRTMLAVMVVGQTVLAACGPAGGILAMAGRNTALMAVMLGSVLVNLALCLVLIPQHGMLGAGIATAVALSLNGVGLALAAWYCLGINTTVLAGAAVLAARRRAQT